MRSASLSDRSSATDGTIFTRVTKCVNSARSDEDDRGIGAGIVLIAQLLQRRRRRRRASAASRTGRRCARGRRARASAARPRRAPRPRHARSPDRTATASRAPSLRPRARSAPAPPVSAVTFSFSAMPARCRTSRSPSTRRRSKRWQRDSTVIGTLRISVVANTNLACGGGSSSVFNSALKAARRQHVHFVEDIDLVARAAPGSSAPHR